MSLTPTEVEITSVSTDGRGVAKILNTICFIDGSVPGDKVLVDPHFDTTPPSATLLKVIEPSPFRVAHPCPHSEVCRGSIWGKIDYDQQLVQKTYLVQRTLKKALGKEIEVQPTVASPKRWHYRNRISLNCHWENDHIHLGYQTEARQEGIGVEIQSCMLAGESIYEYTKKVTEYFQTKTMGPHLKNILRMQIHDTVVGPGVMLVFDGLATDDLKQTWLGKFTPIRAPGGMWFAPGTQAGIVNPKEKVLRNKDSYFMMPDVFDPSEVDYESMEVHPAGFTQANPHAARLVLDKLREMQKAHCYRTVWDLYGGYGALGFAASGTGTFLRLFEVSKFSKTAAKNLAKIKSDVHFSPTFGDMRKNFPMYNSQILAEDLVILDPPHSGTHPEILDCINQSAAKELVYLSCNPARLGRDLALLQQGGFVPTEVIPYDFFPQTYTVEVFVKLTRL